MSLKLYSEISSETLYPVQFVKASEKPADPSDYVFEGAGTQESPYTVKDALEHAEQKIAKTDNTYDTQKVYIKGTVLTVSEYTVSGKTIKDYTVEIGAGNTKLKASYALLADEVAVPAVGDEITIYGWMNYYKSYAIYPKDKNNDETGDWPVIIANVRGEVALSVAETSSDKAHVEGLAATAVNGSEVSFTVRVDEGNELDNVKVNGVEIQAQQDGSYKFVVKGPMSVSVNTHEAGTVQPVLAAKLEFKDGNYTEATDAKSTWSQGGITVVINKGTSTTGCANNGGAPYVNPVRIYKNQTVQVSYEGMVKVVVKCYSGYADEFMGGQTIEGATLVQDGNDVVITFTSAVNSFTTLGISAATRVNAIEVYTLPVQAA
jgi:hypothetical protein